MDFCNFGAFRSYVVLRARRARRSKEAIRLPRLSPSLRYRLSRLGVGEPPRLRLWGLAFCRSAPTERRFFFGNPSGARVPDIVSKPTFRRDLSFRLASETSANFQKISVSSRPPTRFASHPPSVRLVSFAELTSTLRAFRSTSGCSYPICYDVKHPKDTPAEAFRLAEALRLESALRTDVKKMLLRG